MSKKHVLVTGGAGYIGSHACKALKLVGYEPVTFDNLVYGHEEFVKWGPFEKGDVTDSQRLTAVLEKYQPSAVVHFAAFAYVGESVQQPGKYYFNNVFGTLTLLEAMRAAGINSIVFSSTCATYGMPETTTISEEHRQNPINPYGQSKLMVEKILADYDRAYGMKSISLRYFNAAGADVEGEVGEDHAPETHLIPLVLDVAAGKRPNVSIFGADYATPDGTCIRDYIHVADLADAHVHAVQALEAGMASTAFNLGNGHGYSVKEIIDAAERVTGKQIAHDVAPRRPGDPERLVSDWRKAARELDWQPRMGDIELIISHAWQWHRKRFA